MPKKILLIFLTVMTLAGLRIGYRAFTTHLPTETVTLLMPYADIEALSKSDGHPLATTLQALQASGLNAVSITPTATAHIPDITAAGLHIVFRFPNAPGLTPTDIANTLHTIIAHPAPHILLFEGEEILGYPHLIPELANAITSTDIRVGSVELYTQAGINTLARRIPNHILRTHSIPHDEMRLLTPDTALHRFVRAAHVRTARLLMIHPILDRRHSNKTLLQENQSFLQRLTRSLSTQHLTTGLPATDIPPVTPPTLRDRLAPYLVLCICLLIPIVIIQRCTTPITAISTTLIAFLAIAALLNTPVFHSGILTVSAIKLCLILPPIYIFLSPITRKTLITHLKTPVTWAHLIGIAIVAFYLIRSGNGGTNWVFPYEKTLRDTLETFWFIRPRSKEVLLAYPALFFYLSTRAQSLSDTSRKLLATLATIAPVSTLNTICHPHIPFHISLYRSLLGIALGYLLYLCYDLTLSLWTQMKSSPEHGGTPHA